jgi:hypothetical protein
MTLTPTDSTLRYFQRLHQYALAQADELQPAMDRIMESSPVGSPTDRDVKKVLRSARAEDRRRLWSRVQLSCVHMAVNVADHVRALALLLSRPADGIPIYAHSTVARVAIESATSAAYILDRSAPFDLRFGRGIALLISDSDAARRAANQVPGNAYMVAPGPEWNRRHKDLLALIVRSRIEIVLNSKGDPKGVRVAPGAPEALTNVKITELVRERFRDMPAIYNLLSGVTHGMPHALATNAQIANRHGQWDANPLDVGASVLAVANAAHTVLAAHAWHRGRDDDPALTAMRDRIAAVDEAIQQFGRQHMPLPRPAAAAPFLNAKP